MEEESSPSSFSQKCQNAILLISSLCDENISPVQFVELDRLVCSDPEIRGIYVEMMQLHAGLYYYASAMSDMDAPMDMAASDMAASGPFPGQDFDERSASGMDETMVMPAMLEMQQELESEEIFPPSSTSPRQPPRSVLDTVTPKRAAAALLVIGLGLLAYFLPWIGVPSQEPFNRPIPKPLWDVATLDLASNPVWGFVGAPSHDGRYTAGESLVLESGVVQLQLRHNTRLVVEGPAHVRFISDSEISINRGKAVATCPGGGLIVQCPHGTVRDLGTEFAVGVTPDGRTDVEVFKGKVAASILGSGADSVVNSVILTVGQAAMISGKSVTKNPQGAVPQRFVCELQNSHLASLDVADLIGGGDGTTHRRGIAVDPLDGHIGVMEPVTRRKGNDVYHHVYGYPAVDGAFVPGGSNGINGANSGLSQVDSSGDTFQFPPTTHELVNLIWTGGKIPWSDDKGIITDSAISTVLSGVDYATPEHSIICTHSNSAITLNLNAIRRLYPDRVIHRFTCKVGNSFINGWPGSTRVNPPACAFVLSNGSSRFEKRGFTNQDGAIGVDVAINSTDRFLTLAATDDGKDIDRDWILWVDAQFQLTAK